MELTETELLVKVNSLKIRHESLKKEILAHLESMQEKEKELYMVEEEYAKLVEKMIK